MDSVSADNQNSGGVRFDGLDTLRGCTLVSMMLYHAAWDLVYIFRVNWPWYESYGAYLWQQSICWTFLLLSGYCFRLGHRPVRRGLAVFGGGALVTAATVLFMPENRVFWGVLSLLGAAVLLTVPLDRFFRRLPAAVGLGASFGLFLLTRGVPERRFLFLSLPAWLYRNDWTAILGFPQPRFYSTDYFPLLPWLFLFWTGYFLYGLRRPADLPPSLSRLRLPVLTAVGRQSLWVYLLHQPVIYGVLFLWDMAVR